MSLGVRALFRGNVAANYFRPAIVAGIMTIDRQLLGFVRLLADGRL